MNDIITGKKWLLKILYKFNPFLLSCPKCKLQTETRSSKKIFTPLALKPNFSNALYLFDAKYQVCETCLMESPVV